MLPHPPLGSSFCGMSSFSKLLPAVYIFPNRTLNSQKDEHALLQTPVFVGSTAGRHFAFPTTTDLLCGPHAKLDSPGRQLLLFKRELGYT